MILAPKRIEFDSGAEVDLILSWRSKLALTFLDTVIIGILMRRVPSWRSTIFQNSPSEPRVSSLSKTPSTEWMPSSWRSQPALSGL